MTTTPGCSRGYGNHRNTGRRGRDERVRVGHVLRDVEADHAGGRSSWGDYAVKAFLSVGDMLTDEEILVSLQKLRTDMQAIAQLLLPPEGGRTVACGHGASCGQPYRPSARKR
jgi:hypothetical protein